MQRRPRQLPEHPPPSREHRRSPVRRNHASGFPACRRSTDVSLEIAAGVVSRVVRRERRREEHARQDPRRHPYDRTADGSSSTAARRSFTSPRDALAAGVGMVHQELAFCDNLSRRREPLSRRDLPARGGIVDREAMRRRAETMLAEIGTELDVTRELGKLAIAQQQMVQIAAAVGGGARIIVFDEPTSSLSQAEAERLFELIERLKARGVTCIYVSHRMPEIFRLCDTVTVLRDGRHVATRATATLTESELVQLMIGRPARRVLPADTARAGSGDEVLRVEGLTSPGKFEDVSFSVRAGEIVGLAGLWAPADPRWRRRCSGSSVRRADGSYSVASRWRCAARRMRSRSASARAGGPQAAGAGAVGERLHNTSLPILRRLSRLTLAPARATSGAWRASISTGCAYARRASTRPSPGSRAATSRRSCSRKWLAAQLADPDPRRAHARRRRGGEGGDPCADGRARGARDGDPR